MGVLRSEERTPRSMIPLDFLVLSLLAHHHPQQMCGTSSSLPLPLPMLPPKPPALGGKKYVFTQVHEQRVAYPHCRRRTCGVGGCKRPCSLDKSGGDARQRDAALDRHTLPLP